MAGRYGLSLVLTAAAGLLTGMIENQVGPSPYPLFYLAILVSALAGGLGPGLAAVAVSSAAIDVFFLTPKGFLSLELPDLLSLLLFAAIALVIVLLTVRLRRATADREKALRELTEKQVLLEVTLSQLPCGVVCAQGPSGKIILANEQVARILRMPPETRPDMDVRGPDGRRQSTEDWAIYRALRRGEVLVDEETTVTRGDGSRATLLVSASPIRDAKGDIVASVASFYDVTARKEAEESVRHSEKLLRTVLDALPVGVWIADADGVIKTGNPAGLSIWGGARYVGPSDYGQYKGWWSDTGRRIEAEDWALARAIRTGVCSIGEVVEIEGFDGSRKVMLNSAVPIKDEKDRILGAVVVNQDITQLKEAEREIRQLNAGLERRVEERTDALRGALRELEEFAYTVAHDLRAPLRAMSGLSRLLAEDYRDRPLDAQGRDYAGRIVDAAQRMDALILDLLTYSRLSRAEIATEPLSLDAVILDVENEMGQELRERGAAVECSPSGVFVEGHKLALRQALRNLLSNAVKFVAPGAAPRVRIRVERVDGRARLWVEDNGIGIPNEYRDRIFGVFERLHPQEAYPGTGIGLSIVRKAVERMGGRVGVESEPGRGSRFWIELPERIRDGAA